MLGDKSWLDDLGFAYDQHLADAYRAQREPIPFHVWATGHTWRGFLYLAQHTQSQVEAILSGEAGEWPPRAGGNGSGSVCPLSRDVDAWVLVHAVLKGLYKRSRKAHHAVTVYIERGRVAPEMNRALADGKRHIYEWLREAAERCLTSPI